MIEIFKAKDGSDTIKISNVQVHSSYSPSREVVKYVRSKNIEDKELIILCGETLGYIHDYIKLHYPKIKVLVILYDVFFISMLKNKCDHLWAPGKNESLREFLQKNIALIDNIGIDILHWPASEKVFQNVAKDIQSEINQYLLESAGSLNTVKTFGNLWFRNTISNFLAIDNFKSFPQVQTNPVLIAASGPSLQYSFSLMKEYRDRLYVFSLPSALDAIIHEGITPDLIVQTDPGHYATHHLRVLSEHHIPVAMPLSSCRGIWNFDSNVFLFSQNSYLENLIFNNSEEHIPVIPTSGTVAISAMFLAMKFFSNSPILLAGYDFSHDDIMTHITPNSFMDIFRSSSIRTNPLINILFERSFTDKKQSPPLKTYSGWIQNNSDMLSSHVYRIFPTQVTLGNIAEIKIDEAVSLFNKYSKIESVLVQDSDSVLKNIDKREIIDKTISRTEDIIKGIIKEGFTDRASFLNNSLYTEIFLSLKPYELFKLKKDSHNLSDYEFRKRTATLLDDMIRMLSFFQKG